MDTLEEEKKKKALLAGQEYTYDAATNDAYNRYSADAQQAYDQIGQLQDPSAGYAQQLESLYQQYVERQPFSYDPDSDPLYQSYRKQYVDLGQRAMEDTQGRAAALTGGYANTYGVSAGQQAYNSYLQQLSAVIPELYGIAREDYRLEGDRLQDQYAMVSQMGQDAYDRYRDQIEALYQNADYLQGLAKDAYDRGYENWYNGLKMQIAEEQTAYDREQDALAQQQAAQKLAYQQAQDAAEAKVQQEKLAYDRRQDAYKTLESLIAAGYAPTDAELSAAGMTRSQANALKTYYAAKNTPAAKSSSTAATTTATTVGTTTPTKSNQEDWKNIGATVSVTTPTSADIRTMQAALGVTVDGDWGPISSTAAGGRTAKATWLALNTGTSPWKTARAEKFYKDKGTRAQWKARGITDNEYDAMVTNWLKSCGFLPAEICWLKQQFVN